MQQEQVEAKKDGERPKITFIVIVIVIKDMN